MKTFIELFRECAKNKIRLKIYQSSDLNWITVRIYGKDRGQTELSYDILSYTDERIIKDVWNYIKAAYGVV